MVQNQGSHVYVCSLIVGHAGQHEAWESHKVGPVGGCLSAWPQETKTGPANITTFAELRDLVIELGARETETRLRHAERLDAFEDRLQRLRDDTRDAAAAAGEALERTKGLQVPEILRRLANLERARITATARADRMDSRIHDLERNEPEQVQLELPPTHLAVLTSAVTELTTVMREAVAAQREGAVLVQRGLDALTPPEVCGAPDQIGHVTCELEKGHTSRHVNGISSWPQVPCGVSRLADGDKYPCERPAGHGGLHRDRAGCSWPQKADPEPRTCPATMSWHDVPVGPRTHRCTRSAGHTGPHRDQDGDDWEVTGV
jgi:hypothetical protein